MNCKSCGAPLDASTKVCANCSSPNDEAMKNQDLYDDPHQGYQDLHAEKSNVYGKQFYAGSSNDIEPGEDQRGKGTLSKLIGIAVLIVAAIYIFSLLGEKSPIYDLQLGVELDVETLYPVEEIGYIIESEGYIFVSYSTRDLDIGEVITASWYETTDGDVFMSSETETNSFEEQVGYFEYSKPGGWTVGDYELRFEVDGEIIAVKSFEVKAE